MNETLSKIRLYLRPTRYWRAVPPREVAADRSRYPIDFGDRLKDGHFSSFDASGVPVRPTRAGPVHNYTRICGWALAHWSRRRGGNWSDGSKAAFMLAAEYLVGTAEPAGASLNLRAEIPGSGHVGAISGMSQGQAMSVLTRAYLLTGEERFAEAAEGCMGPFRRTVAEGGVTLPVGTGGGLWFEEDTTHPRHILNGMVFALWGLEDVSYQLRIDEAHRLYQTGMQAVHELIGKFDTGWWSTYDAPERSRAYIASARYHDLHIAQLQALGAQDENLARYADRFATYGESTLSRIRAATAMARAKMRSHYPRTDAYGTPSRYPSSLGPSGGARRHHSPDNSEETGVETRLDER